MMRTDRILLRSWQESDAEAFFKIGRDPDVLPRAGWSTIKSEEEALETIQSNFLNDYCWAIESISTKELIGFMMYCNQKRSNIPIGPNDCKVGGFIDKAYWNMGIGTEALRLVIDYCMNVKHFCNIWSDCFLDNPISERWLKKCGFSDTEKLVQCQHEEDGLIKCVKLFKFNPSCSA